MDTREIKSALESLIFVAEEPISLEQLAKLIERGHKKELRAILDELMEEYTARGSGIELAEVAGGFQFRTAKDNSKWVSKLMEERPQRLTRASLETLAIIAYRQPLVRQDVERIRGVDSGGVIKTLLERNLIRIVGRQDVPGRPVLYGTTNEFLEFFGLKTLSDLPPLRDIAELGDAAEEFIKEYADREGATEAGIPGDPTVENPPVAPDTAEASSAAPDTEGAPSAEPENEEDSAEREIYGDDEDSDGCHEDNYASESDPFDDELDPDADEPDDEEDKEK